MNLFTELKRRNVFRVALFYIVAAWVVIQVAETLLPVFAVPDSAIRIIVLILALGFPLAVVFSWVFELTPEGIRREKDVEVSAVTKQQTAHKLNWATLVAAVLAIGLIAVDRMMPERAPLPGAEAPAEVATVDSDETNRGEIDKSIAVLPFSDFSPGGDSQWFADGLSEEILNSLVHVPDLLVASRTSSFSFRNSGQPITEIAAALGVAHVLEGSVRMGDDRVRVTAQLIRASDGFHVWSNNFDREIADMIGIQEDLARQISTAMETTMDPEALAAMADAGTKSVEAYRTYLRGRSAEGQGSSEAYALFEQARQIDPGFAVAHYRAALYWDIQTNLTSMVRADLELTPAETRERLQERIAAAIQTADDPMDAMLYRAVEARHQLRLREAARLLGEYVTQRPGDNDAGIMASDLALYTGDTALFELTLDQFRDRAFNEQDAARNYIMTAHASSEPETVVAFVPELVARWPNNSEILYQAQRALLWVGRVEQARELHDRFLERPPQWMRLENRLILRLRQACAEGRVDEALALIETAPADIDLDLSSRWVIADILSRPDEAEAALKTIEAEDGAYGLVHFLVYPQFDARRYPSLVRVLERERIPIREPRPVPFACPTLGTSQ
ncbi:MAG: hypothetical protein V2J10_05690 [Wenzhouxiangella sp.]|jgi:TolB-like protein|nr:hypothetical protein [Wenzhouxiangella sp.]